VTDEPNKTLDADEVIHAPLRTKVCIWIIALGLTNFLVYALLYDSIGGEAVNGAVRPGVGQDGAARLHYHLTDSGKETEVGRGVWIYSAVHSISIWVTVGAVLLAMLTLAKDRIVSSMRRSIVRGRTFITVLATLVTLISVWMTVRFTLEIIEKLAEARSALTVGGTG
jgi:hypothetical protein